ncbi:unnamed protein product, partial [Phaeothamnion confervicola]
LTNGLVYSFRVVAINAFGHSAPSLPSNKVLLFDPSDPCGLVMCGQQGECFLRDNRRGGWEGYCICRPGYSGADCDVAEGGALAAAASYAFVPGPWSTCDRTCSGGFATRALRCAAFRNGRHVSGGSSGSDGLSSASPSASARLRALQERPCRAVPCLTQFLTVSLRLRLYYDDVCFDVAAQDAFYAGFGLEVAQALLISLSRVHDVNATRTERSSQMEVRFVIAPGDGATDQPIDKVATELRLQMQSVDSAFRRQGIWTPLALPDTLEISMSVPQLSAMDVRKITYKVVVVLVVFGAALLACAMYGAWSSRKRKR